MIKRAIGFGAVYWLLIFFIISVLMFFPGLADKLVWQRIIFWLLMIPVTLGLAKWFFRTVDPTPINGLWLWLIAMIVGTALDAVITIPVFITAQHDGDMGAAFAWFYSQWHLYVGFVWSLLLLVYAGYEFDRPAHFGLREETPAE